MHFATSKLYALLVIQCVFQTYAFVIQQVIAGKSPICPTPTPFPPEKLFSICNAQTSRLVHLHRCCLVTWLVFSFRFLIFST